MHRAVALVGTLVLLVAAVYGLSAQYESTVTNSGKTDITNESFVVENNTTNYLNGSNKTETFYAEDNESVAVYQNGTQFQPKGNWSWQPENGSLFVANRTGLNHTANATANISYHYWEASSQQTTVKDIMLIPAKLGEGLAIVVGAALLLLSVGILGRGR